MCLGETPIDIGLLHVSKLVWAETAPLFYGRCTFRFFCVMHRFCPPFLDSILVMLDWYVVMLPAIMRFERLWKPNINGYLELRLKDIGRNASHIQSIGEDPIQAGISMDIIHQVLGSGEVNSC